MRVDEVRATIARRISLFAIAVLSVSFLSAPLNAQDEDVVDDQQDSSDEEERLADEVVVTGSRLKRDTYTSIAPLQVITGQMSREVGVIDPSTILQESTAASGVQIDLTFSGFVLDNGPGTSTVDLRGLGGTRTLVLINGRRAAPSGVEGAPVSPDLNMIPSSLVQQYEILLDGASSVYGSDAIAGVANIILRKDFDGLELEAYSSIPAADGSAGMVNTLSAAWGYNGDRGFVGLAAEYGDGEALTFDDRSWTAGCNKHMEVDENGQVRNDGLLYNYLYGMRTDPCRITGFTRRAWYEGVQELGGAMFGSLYYTAGTSNVGIPNLSEATILDYPLDQNQDGVPDIDFNNYNVNGAWQDGQLYPDRNRLSFMSYGEYTFSGDANITPYYEATYNRSKVEIFEGGSVFGGSSQLVPGSNPYNPCNPDGINGVDCGIAYDNLLDDPNFAAGFASIYGGTPAQYRDIFGLDFYSGPLGPTAIGANFSIPGERDFYEVDIDQVRVVGGIKGDLPFLKLGSMEDWSFDISVLHTESSGTSRRGGISEAILQYSLDTSRFSVPGDPNSEIICGNNDGCVPINMFSPSLYQGLSPRDNDFASQAERDYVMADRLFKTDYTQSMASYYMTGDLFSMPAGTALAGIGFEYRRDEIDSIPNDVARNGELWGYFSDEGAIGDKDTKEAFAELELPLLAGVTAFKELTVNLSTRYTKDDFYDGAWTYSGKLAWRPVDSLLIRGTVGTSYRAPNLQELFMLGQSGFRNSTFDPCAVGPDAWDPIGGYDPSQDTRDPWVLANCRADGVDPETLGGGRQIFSQEVFKTGSFNLEEEKSDSFTAGITWEQPFFSAFDLSIAATYYEIKVRDEIIRLVNQYSINDCYNDIEGDSTLCRVFTRDPVTGFLDFADEIFLNRDSLKTRGVDINVAFDWPTQMFGRAVDLGADFAFNRKLQLETRFVNPDNFEVDTFDYAGDFGSPEWEGITSIRADIGDYRVTWGTRYLGSVSAPPLEPFNNIVESGSGDTCLGPIFDDVNCRDISYADNYFRHDMSIYYRGDVWTLGGGFRNVFDEAPPQVDANTFITTFNNTPVGAGYDLFGRTLFLNVQARFE